MQELDHRVQADVPLTPAEFRQPRPQLPRSGGAGRLQSAVAFSLRWFCWL